MADQSASVACLLLLLLALLPPPTLAQDSCYYSYLPYYNGSSIWPGCLLSRLTNRLNTTYYIRPDGSENTSCTALQQPCFNFTEFRDKFFVTNDVYYETIPSGNASLVFLPGNHSLPLDDRHRFLDFIDVTDAPTSNSISFTAYKHTQPTVIKCERAMSSSLNSGVYLSAFKRILLDDIQFENCVLQFWQNEALLITNAVFNTTLLDVRFIASVSISDSDIMMVSNVFCSNVEQRGLFYSNNSHVTLTNVTLAVPNNNVACENPKVVVFNNGVLEIANSEFSGKAVHVIISAATMNVLGVTQFGKGINAILAVSSTVNIDGNVRFINNTASLGAAIYLSRSHVTIADNATVLFQDNHAKYVGGAIFSPGGYIADYVTIGQPTVDPCQITFSPKSNVKFINNTAESGGSAMYGITISRLVCDYTEFPRSYDSLSNVLSIEPDEPSAVSSDPLRVCICPDQSTPDCLAILPDQNVPHLHYSIYPGQEFFIHAAIVGFNFAMTGGSVYAQFLNSNATLALRTQKVQQVHHTGCAQLRYTVLSDQPNETLVLTANRRHVTGFPNAMDIARDILVLNKNQYTFATLPYSYFPNPRKYYDQNETFATNQTDNVFRLAGYLPDPLQDISVFVSLTLIACPLGSTLSQQSQSCRCDERFLEHDLTCNFVNQTVQRSGTIWIKLTFGNNSIDEVIVHQPCPFGYCKQDLVDVPFNDSNAQCAYNRAGTLCGACKPNFCLTLGGAQCRPNCSNRSLSLLIPFALAGFALVFFIKILNLTVSQGTINGLIFYANIIAAARSIIFPQPPYNKFLSFLSGFISWLNLDLGIETCFIKGLDGYWKTWLQFVFPFYVWAIAGAIILVSRYSLRATKLFGENSLSVLATLFFLSYAKLLRSAITIFSSTTLSSNTTSSTVWAFDGNVEYLASKHIPLFLFALAVVLLLWLPYTAVLLSARWMRTQSHRKGLRWLKPFLDAYYGPFKDKHHYWVGVLLVVRGVLFILFAAFFATESFVSLLLVTVSSIFLAVCLSVTGRQYKKSYLSALESSFFLNLGVLAAGTLYIKLAGGNLEALVTISIGITFVQFVGIVTFHSYYFVIIPLRMWRRNLKSKEAVRVQRLAASPTLSTTFVMVNESVPSTDIYFSRLHSTTSDPTRPDQLILALNKGSSSINPSRSESFEILTNAAAREAKGARSRSEAAAVLSSDLAPPPPDHRQGSYDPPRYFAAKREAEFETDKLVDFVTTRESLLDYMQ